MGKSRMFSNHKGESRNFEVCVEITRSVEIAREIPGILTSAEIAWETPGISKSVEIARGIPGISKSVEIARGIRNLAKFRSSESFEFRSLGRNREGESRNISTFAMLQHSGKC